MKHLFRGSRLIVFVMMLSVMTACAISGSKVPRTKLAAPTTEDQTKPTLSYLISLTEPKKLELLGELTKSQYFKEITEGHSVEADIELNVTLSVKPSPNAGITDFMAYTTFTIIPSWESEYYKVTARVKNKKGLEKEYTVNYSTLFVAWYPLVVFAPFTYITDEIVRRNIFRNIIQQMYDDGFMSAI